MSVSLDGVKNFLSIYVNLECISEENTTYLELAGDFCLSPVRYLWEGRTVTVVGFSYEKEEISFPDGSYLETALAIFLLIPGFIIGGILKASSFIWETTVQIHNNVNKTIADNEGIEDQVDLDLQESHSQNTDAINWDGTSLLPFNEPFLVTADQLSLLGMQPNLSFSKLSQYADSIFRASWIDTGLLKIVRIKNEASINGEQIQLPAIKGPNNANEGMRVRTFCLELLSNLEDNIILKANTKKREELIQCVKYYLENIAFLKQAGFTDYNDFLSILIKEVPECGSIFLKHRNIIELQRFLPKSTPSKSSHWEKVRIIVRSGLLTPNLSEGASRAIQHGLRPLPPAPKRQRIIKLYSMLDAINTLATDYREAGRWLMHKIRIITFRELCSSIKKSCFSLHEEIANWEDFTFLTIPGKSQAWVADIAYRYLPIEKLTAVLTMTQRYTGREIYRHMTQSRSHNFLMFDDGAYSCEQFTRYLDEFAGEMREKEAFAATKNLYFIFGHFPKSKYESLSEKMEKFKKHNVNMKIITNNFTHSWENVKLDDITKRASELSRRDKSEVVTEWKRPDFFSTSLYITEGYHNLKSKAHLGELSVEMGSVETMNGEGPIAKIATPYLSECRI